MSRIRLIVFWLLPVLILLSGCERPNPEVTVVATRAMLSLPPTSPVNTPDQVVAQRIPPPPTSPVQSSAGQGAGAYSGTPTPDATRPGAGGNGQTFGVHVVAVGETLGIIALNYGSSIDELVAINGLDAGQILYAGQEIRVPGGEAALVGPSFKLAPDSELVYGPGARGFETRQAAAAYNGYLLAYQEEVEGALLSGPEIVQLVAHRYSVNPRLLLAALEYKSGWVTAANAIDNGYPLGRAIAGGEGLYWQLSWTADQLNWGYYGRAEGGINSFLAGNVTRVAFAPDINDGTAGVQFWLGAGSSSYESWQHDVGPDGFYATYESLFGNPFAYAVEPLWPATMAQPVLQLPWPAGETWYFTGGPHGGWASGSAWAALDFVPDGEQLGCYSSDDWVTAMAGGVVTRSDFGAVVVDLDGDGYAGTGWAITYMHLETTGRVAVGTTVQAGDPLGHPSCEGGFSNGTHVHISRTFNGRWVAADGNYPFVMGGWASEGLAREYDGLLVRGDDVKEACTCREELNAITAGE